MIKNFFKVAYRNIMRHKGFSFINIAGLTLGLTVCLLIGLFVRDERQFDRFLPEGDQVYRIYDFRHSNAGTDKTAMTPPMFATTLQQYPEVEKTLRVMQIQAKTLFEAGSKKLYEEYGVLAEPSFFDIFPLQLRYGTYKGALDGNTSIVISDQLAVKYFGNADPIGKQIIVDIQPYQVTAVYLSNTKFHLPVQYILPLAAGGIENERMESWHWQQFNNYIKLKKGSGPKVVEAKFQHYIREKIVPTMRGEGYSYQPFLQPLKDIHLYSASFKFDMAVRGDISYVQALTIIAIFILLIACFNFVNLATARSLQRAKEVGVRKAIGAGKGQLMVQYMTESLLFAFISIILSTALTFFLLPALNRFTEKQFVFDLFSNPLIGLLLILLAFIVGLIAGIYPALVLSRFQAVRVLKGATVSDQPGKIQSLRHGLVVVQFTLSVLLIISAVVVIRQVNYLHNKDLGFNKDQIMFFPMRGDQMNKNYEAFRNDLLQSPGITSVSIGYGFPGDMFAGDGIIVPHSTGQKEYSVNQLMVDYDYIKTLGLQVIAGRDFSKEMLTDKDHAYMLNETAVQQLGFGTPEKALGKELLWRDWNAKGPDSLKRGQVIGVLKDFNYKSLYDKIEPAVLQIYPAAYWKVAVKMKTAGIAGSIAHVQKTWDHYAPDYPIEFKFLDENFTQMYKAEDKLKTLLWLFTGLAIFIGCLGLFGLAAYTAERRKKEVGIRKVLGASVQGIAVLLSKDFVKLVLIALVIASPIAWYFMHQWLQDFAYRISISWWIFVLAGITALLIAIVTVSFQAIKAAVTNPVKNLRSE